MEICKQQSRIKMRHPPAVDLSVMGVRVGVANLLSVMRVRVGVANFY